MTIIIPQHEQHYPTKVLSRRLEEYIRDDKEPTENRAYATLLTGSEVFNEVIKQQGNLGLRNIDSRYFVGTCFHESGCLNEWDTEIATPHSIEGFQSAGPYQIGAEEASRYGYTLQDMLVFIHATACMIRLAEDNRDAIRTYAKLNSVTPDPDYIDDTGKVWVGGTMRAYLAIGHNHGLSYVGKTIRTYGMDWKKYKLRNPTDNIVAHSYGEDCITGGLHYPRPVAAVRKLLQLTKPLMSGEDVRELQRHLKIATDGIFGPTTEAELIKFQKSKGLAPNGICGDTTWNVLLAK